MRFYLSSLPKNRWYLILLISITLYLIFAWSLEHPLAASQITSTSTPVGRIPIYQIAGFEDVTVGKTTWSSLVPTLVALNYDIYYAFRRPTDELVYAVRVSRPTVDNLEVPDITLGVDVNDNIITLIEASFRSAIAPQFSSSLWNMIAPANLISAYGVPDRIMFNVGGGASYRYGVTFFWRSSNLVVIYEGLILKQDERGTTFRVCMNLDRVLGATMFTAISFAELQQQLLDMHFVAQIDDLSPDMLIGSTHLVAVSQQLVTEECLVTPVNRWVHLQYTWTPWAGYTDTPTPTLTLTPMTN